MNATNPALASNATVAACIPTLTSENCAESMVEAVLIYCKVFAALGALAFVVFTVSVLRRFYYLREPFNTWWAYTLCVSLWIPSWAMYFAEWLAFPHLLRPPSPFLTSITQWVGFIGFFMHAIFVVNAYAQLGRKKKMVKDGRGGIVWSKGLIAALVSFPPFLLVCAILSGFSHYYPITERLILATFGAGALLTWLVIFPTHRKAQANLANVKSAQTRLDSAPDIVQHIKRVSTAQVITAMIAMFIFTSVFIVHCALLEAINKHVWAVMLFWSVYRTLTIFRIFFLSFQNFNETSFKMAQKRHLESISSGDTTSTL